MFIFFVSRVFEVISKFEEKSAFSTNLKLIFI